MSGKSACCVIAAGNPSVIVAANWRDKNSGSLQYRVILQWAVRRCTDTPLQVQVLTPLDLIHRAVEYHDMIYMLSFYVAVSWW